MGSRDWVARREECGEGKRQLDGNAERRSVKPTVRAVFY